MTQSSASEEETAAREAADWLLLLEEDPDLRLRPRFARWLRARPANRPAWDATVGAYDLIGPAASIDGADVRPIRARRRAGLDRLRPRRPPGPRFSRRQGGVLAGLAVLGGCGAILAPLHLLEHRADLATGPAEHRTVQVAGGVTVQLGARSAITVDPAGRGVRLLEGKAYIEVRHDPRRPFVVVAQNVQLTDLGTGFEVSLERGEAKVAVSHGEVEVRYTASTAALKAGAGQWVRVSKTGAVERGMSAPSQIAAWRDGRLVASDRPMTEVVDDLRPSFRGLIILADGDLARRRVTGVYDLANPAGALQAMANVQPGASVRRVGPWLLVISDR